MLVTKLHYHSVSKVLDVHFDNDTVAQFSAEMLRVLSPSAEVQQHGNPILVANKKDVGIVKISPVGHYAARLIFDDGHNTGLYSWEFFANLAKHKEQLWAAYLENVKRHNATRDALIPIKIK